MNLKELERLEKLAKEATPGPWSDCIDIHDSSIEAIGGGCVCHVQWYANVNTMAKYGERFSHADAKFIAAANPATTLKLIASLKRAYEALERYKGCRHACQKCFCTEEASQAVQDIEKEFGG